MKPLNKISQWALLLLVLSAVVLSESGCSSHQKGYNYSSHSKRNKSAQRHEKKRLKKADNNPINFRCRNFKKK